MENDLPEAKKAAAVTGWRRTVQEIENLLVVAPLALMTIFALLEIVLRQFNSGISGGMDFVKHFTLMVGMAGGAIAARDDRLLALSTLSTLLKGFWKTAAAVISRAISAATTTFLCLAGADFIQSERLAGSTMAQGIPSWIVQLMLPVGFAAIAVRLVWTAAETWKPRLLTAVLAAGLVGLGLWMPFEPETIVTPCLILILVGTVLGGPVYALPGGAALVLLYGGEYPVSSIPIKHYSLVTNASLPSIPLFTLAGYFLAQGGASTRLVRVFQAWVGHLRGGPAVLTALVCAFFTSFTGASGVTILALGGLLMPVLLRSGYSDRNALGLLTGAGSLGLLFPPCLPPILYAIVASGIAANLGKSVNISMEKVFLGGLLPGVLMVIMTALWGIWVGPAKPGESKPFDRREAWNAMWDAKWEMLLPVVALAFLFGGFATPVEASAVTAAYAALVEIVFYRDYKSFAQVRKTMTECGLLVGGVLLILGVAMGFTQYLVMEEVPGRMVDWVQAHIHSRWAFLLALNLLLLVVGCLMDIFSAIVVVVPLIVPVAFAFEVDPIHLGIIFLANLELGYLTPPVGMNLFLSAYRFEKSMGEVTRATLPLLIVLTIGVFLITYVPWLSTWLPSLVK